MGSLDKKTKTHQQSTSQSDLTDWSKNQYDTRTTGITDVLDNFMKKPFELYTGPIAPDMTHSQKKAREIASTINGATQVAGPTAVDYRTFDADRVRERFNPFEQDVVNSIDQFYDDDVAGKIADNQSHATANGSYGGSRHGVRDATLQAESIKDKASLVSDLKYRGWNDAAAGDERESANLYGAGVRNSDADYESRRDNAVRNDQAVQQQVQMMSQLGMEEYEIEKAKNLAEKARYDERANEEWKRFQTELAAKFNLLGATPLLTKNSSTSSGTQKTSDPIGQITSVMNSVGGLFDGIGKFGGGG